MRFQPFQQLLAVTREAHTTAASKKSKKNSTAAKIEFGFIWCLLWLEELNINEPASAVQFCCHTSRRNHSRKIQESPPKVLQIIFLANSTATVCYQQSSQIQHHHKRSPKNGQKVLEIRRYRYRERI